MDSRVGRVDSASASGYGPSADQNDSGGSLFQILTMKESLDTGSMKGGVLWVRGGRNQAIWGNLSRIAAGEDDTCGRKDETENEEAGKGNGAAEDNNIQKM